MNHDNINLDKAKIKLTLENALKKSKTYTEQECHDIVFHMTDWLNDLVYLFKLYENPDSYKHKKIVDILGYFLVHVPNHIAAAAKIMLDQPVEDIFKIGAVKTETDDNSN